MWASKDYLTHGPNCGYLLGSVGDYRRARRVDNLWSIRGCSVSVRDVLFCLVWASVAVGGYENGVGVCFRVC